ncbi:MAG: zinc ABC transporter substrate-binding protein [Muribaculaceae bacterium]|nr:zinc ABC transporter substrate-binding protein [Muribaculaceae bacterium]
MKSIKIYLATFVLAGLFTGCTGSSQSNNKDVLDVIVSIPPQAELVKAIAKDKANVTSLTTSSVNPEIFEPAINSLIALENSDIYMPVGTLGFESAMINRISESGKSTVVADMSTGIKRLYGTHEHHDDEAEEHDHEHHHHGSADPHIWSSPRNLSIMVDNIERALSKADKANSDFYHENAVQLKNHIDSIDNVIKSVTDTLNCRTFIVWHPSLSYLANDYGLKQLVVGSHGKDMSVKQLHERLDKAVNENVKVFFFQQEFDAGNATEIQKRTGAKMVTINPMNGDWEKEFKLITDGLQL